MFRRSILIFQLVLPAVIFLSAFVNAFGQQQSPGILDRIKNIKEEIRKGKKSSYSGKVYNSSGGFIGKNFETREYAKSKEFQTTSFATKTFGEDHQSWMAKLLFPQKKLSDKLQKMSSDSDKKFATKEIPPKTYSDLEKKDPYSIQNAYSTREYPKKIQILDNNAKLQEELKNGVKKGLTEDEVRNLLNKGP